jgi:hypothetical protein
MRHWQIALTAVLASCVAIGAAHAITVTVFKYSSPKSGWLTINPSDLVPESNVITYSAGSASLVLNGSVAGCFFAPLHLPQGARMGQVIIWYLSDAGGSDLQFQVIRTRLSDNLSDLTFKNAHDDSFTRKSAALIVPAAWATVNNGGYRYDFVYCPQSNDNIFYGGRVAYTYGDAGD